LCGEITKLKRLDMRVYVISCAVAAAIALGAAVTLHYLQEPAAVAFSTTAVRL
jgi:hypothetical protein